MDAPIQRAYRIGNKVEEKIRPLRITLNTADAVHNVIQSAKRLNFENKGQLQKGLYHNWPYPRGITLDRSRIIEY